MKAAVISPRFVGPVHMTAARKLRVEGMDGPGALSSRAAKPARTSGRTDLAGS